jgi:hypothetical protein
MKKNNYITKFVNLIISTILMNFLIFTAFFSVALCENGSSPSFTNPRTVIIDNNTYTLANVEFLLTLESQKFICDDLNNTLKDMKINYSVIGNSKEVILFAMNNSTVLNINQLTGQLIKEEQNNSYVYRSSYFRNNKPYKPIALMLLGSD